MASNSSHDQRLKDADKKFKEWKKRMQQAGYVVRGNNAFKRTDDKTSPSGYRDKRVASFSSSGSSSSGSGSSTTTRKEGQRATLNGKPVVWKNGEWKPVRGRNWSNGQGAKSDKPSEGDRSTWPTRKKSEANTGGGGGGNNTSPTPPQRNQSPAPAASSTPKRNTTQGPVKDGKTYGQLLDKRAKRRTATEKENDRVRGETKAQLKKQGMSNRMAQALSGIGKWKDPDEKKRGK